jgi:hypothetical protein
MKIKNLFALIMALQVFVLFSISIGCSKEKDGPALMEKVKKVEESIENTKHRKSIEDPLHEKYMATIEQCSEKYQVCLEKCAKENSSDKCSGKCEKALSLCEKDIPDDLKTIK